MDCVEEKEVQFGGKLKFNIKCMIDLRRAIPVYPQQLLGGNSGLPCQVIIVYQALVSNSGIVEIIEHPGLVS